MMLFASLLLFPSLFDMVANESSIFLIVLEYFPVSVYGSLSNKIIILFLSRINLMNIILNDGVYN